MIRQAISCDICGAEKRQTNHWFVVHAHGGELRITGWNASGGRTRAGSKHLCGQTCLHKLLDEFIAGTMSTRTAPAPESADRVEPAANTDASLTSKAAYSIADAPVRPMPVLPAPVIAISPVRNPDEAGAPVIAPLLDDLPISASRRRRAEAWERERERERRTSMTTHRRTL